MQPGADPGAGLGKRPVPLGGDMALPLPAYAQKSRCETSQPRPAYASVGRAGLMMSLMPSAAVVCPFLMRNASTAVHLDLHFDARTVDGLGTPTDNKNKSARRCCQEMRAAGRGERHLAILLLLYDLLGIRQPTYGTTLSTARERSSM